MKGFRESQKFVLVCALVLFLFPAHLFPQNHSEQSKTIPQSTTERDPQHDFDWEIGSWKIHTKRLQQPLTGSDKWIELDGTVVVRKIWAGRGNLAEIELGDATGHIEFLSLRLYNPQSHQWSLNFASSNVGTLSQPMIGEFKNGRGEFYDQESFRDKSIFVRFVFLPVSGDSGRSEQAFSEDGGKTWEVNWINTYTRAGAADGRL